VIVVDRERNLRSSAIMNSSPSGRVPKGNASPFVRAALSATLSAAILTLLTATSTYAQVTSYAVVPNAGEDTASVIDTKTRTVRPTPVTVGSVPEAAAWTPNGRFAFVTNPFDGTVSIFSVAANVNFSSASPVGLFPAGVVASPDAKLIYVANSGSDTISVLDARNGAPSPGGAIVVPGEPFGLTISPDGSRLYATSIGSGDLTMIDTATRTVLDSVNIGCQPSGVVITPDASTLYVASCLTDTVNVYNALTLAAGPEIPVGEFPENVAITPDGRWVYVTNHDTDDVSVIDTTTNTVLTTITGFLGPSGVSVTPDGKEVYVSNYLDDTISVVDVATNTIVDTLTVGLGPTGKNVFIGPSFVVADGGPLMLASDAELDPLGFRRWIPMSGGTIVLTDHVTSTRQFSSLHGGGGTLDTNGFDATFNGIDLFYGAFTKAGAGTLTLTGLSEGGFSSVFVEQGRLLVNGVHDVVDVVVNGTSTLGGVGQLKAVDINGSAELTPGDNGPGILRVANVEFSAGSTLRLELNGDTVGTGYDRLLVDTTATLGGATLAVQTGFAPAAGTVFMIVTNASGTFAGLPQGSTYVAPGGLRFRVSYTAGDGNDVTLTVEGPPAIGPITDRTTIENQPIAPIDFTVTDDFTAPAALIVTVSSSNQALVTDAQLALTGTGTTRTLTITPAPGATGTSTITVTASDGVLSSQRSFELTVTPLLRYVLSEGATGEFFDTDILIANPHDASTPVDITFSTQDGVVITQTRTLLPMSQTRIKLDEIAGLEATSVSTMVTSLPDAPIVVERTMRWDATGYGAHAEKASPGTATNWYFAEGSQGFFSTFLLLANPHATANVAHVTWLLEGFPPIQRDYSMGPASRVTVHAGDDAELVARSFGAHVVFDQPGMAERAMYFGANPFWSGGHAAAGISTPSTTWFLAEGATGTYFTTYVLLANPNAQPTEITMRYLPASGAPVTRTYTLAAQQRLTLNLAFEDPSLANAAIATEVTATLPVIAERAQYWPNPVWSEAHASAGVTATGTRWGLADGLVGGAQNHQTYILLANPGANDAMVTLTFLRPTGETITRFFNVPAASRRNVAVAGLASDVPELINASFGTLIESTQPIAVERSMYSDAGGLVWAAGTNVTATRLP
jgi:YVTN family beta-propeller protein